MKILYAIQGTGNGHIARAEDVIPVLQQYGELDLLVSGVQADIKIPYPLKYTSAGLSFYFGKKGGIDLVKTFKKNNARGFYKDIKKIPVENYDLVINDFEPVTAWACRKKQVPCVALSHQAALLSPQTPRAKVVDPIGEWIIHNYANANAYVGFHFDTFDKNIFTPVIRASVRQMQVKTEDHYTVYLPAYDDKKLVPLLAKIPGIRWHIFSKHARKMYHEGKISVFPVDSTAFAASMTSCTGVLCGAGFETPAEALFLGKKLMVTPMKFQYEQHCNAAALKQMGVPVLKNVKKKRLDKIVEWIESDKRVAVQYHNVTADAVQCAIEMGKKLF